MGIWLFRCLSAFTFLTKIQIPYNPSIEDKDFQRNIIFFPIVGAVLGLILSLAAQLLSISLSPLMASTLLVAFYVMLTGGLHLDGVGDSFDGLFSYRDKSRILEIMKDSRVGTNGILGILFVLLIKLFAFSDLIETARFIPIIYMPLVGRLALVVACYKGKNAREKGMGRTYIGNITKKDVITAFVIASILIGIALLQGFQIVFMILLAMIVSLVYVILVRFYVYKKIDGITGDILGLVCETSEAVFLVLCLFLN